MVALTEGVRRGETGWLACGLGGRRRLTRGACYPELAIAASWRLCANLSRNGDRSDAYFGGVAWLSGLAVGFTHPTGELKGSAEAKLLGWRAVLECGYGSRREPTTRKGSAGTELLGLLAVLECGYGTAECGC